MERRVPSTGSTWPWRRPLLEFLVEYAEITEQRDFICDLYWSLVCVLLWVGLNWRLNYCNWCIVHTTFWHSYSQIVWASWRYLACMANSILHLDFIRMFPQFGFSFRVPSASRLSWLRSFEWGGRQKTGASVGNKCLAQYTLNCLLPFAYAIHVLFLLISMHDSREGDVRTKALIAQFASHWCRFCWVGPLRVRTASHLVCLRLFNSNMWLF